MEVHKLTSTDGFIAFDLGDAPAVGVVRQAPKVLRDGAELLARSTTYAAASFGLQRRRRLGRHQRQARRPRRGPRRLPRGGGAARRERPLAPRSRRRASRPTTSPAWPRADERAAAFDQTAAGESAVAAALGALGILDGKQVAIVGNGPDRRGGGRVGRRQRRHRRSRRPAFDAACDALLVAGKAGVLEHDLAATVQAKVVVPLTPVPVTARALAVLGRAGRGRRPRLPVDGRARSSPPSTPTAATPMLRVHDAVAALAGEGTNLWMAAVAKAEEHLRTWQDAAALRPSAGVAERQEPRPEEVEDLLEGVAGGLTGLVDQVLGEHGVGRRGMAVRVALRRVDLDADEAVAERLPQVGEPLRGHQTCRR